MIIVAFIYSFTAPLGKMAIEHSSPIFFGVTYFASLTLCLTPVALHKNKATLMTAYKDGVLRATVLPGVFTSLVIVAHTIAMSLTKVAYMISVKRLSLLIGVVYGYLLFKEQGIREHTLGTILMLIGFVLIVLFQ